MLIFILAIAAIIPPQFSPESYSMLGWNRERACLVRLIVNRRGVVIAELPLPQDSPYYQPGRDGR